MSTLNHPEELQYTPEHKWVRREGDVLFVGVTDFAQSQLGEVVFVDLPEAGVTITAGEEFGSIESIKVVSELYMPVTAVVAEVNEALMDDPTIVNTAPYTDGWMLKLTGFDEAALEALITNAEYVSSTAS
ncbi:MAG: glycine cleavage system protein GcvH [Desulfovibrionales bacterium]|nr:glycine cleavage system protein GcvH [Desulfovibrionales bacterium]